MSQKIKEQLKNKDKIVVIAKSDFQYLNSIENIRFSMNHYLQQLESEYIKLLTINLGYKPEEDLAFSIDFKDDSRELTIHKVTEAEKEAMQPKSDLRKQF